jgi:hypothetical protein
MYGEKFCRVLHKYANCQAELLDTEPTKFSYIHSDHAALFPAILLAALTSHTPNTLQTKLQQKVDMLSIAVHTCLSPHKNLKLHFELSLLPPPHKYTGI